MIAIVIYGEYNIEQKLSAINMTVIEYVRKVNKYEGDGDPSRLTIKGLKI